jgi:acetone carboxylase gamma subunit
MGGMLAYEFNHAQGGTDKVEAGVLFGKKLTNWTHLANIIIAQEVGNHKNANPEYDVKWQTLHNYSSLINPGVEYYGEFGEISHSQGWDAQKHRFGPVITGIFGHGIAYELGWLVGLSQATSDHAIKLNLEYEFPM